jgi:Carboxypeptidase regulatory-like domain
MELFSTEHRAHMRPRFRILALAALLTIAGATAAVAQESRGSISGRVVDSSGGVLPGVTVIIVNTGTNSTSTVVTGESGQFTAPLLISGTYRVTVELSGFRSMVREPVEVRVGDRLQVDFTLEPAGVSSEVVVIGQSPLLDSGTATMGQVIDSKLIGEMPLGDGTAYGLARLVPGASFERSYALQRPMDNDNLRGLTISGTINSEFTIDGSSNIVSGARVGIQPPSDSIQEFKIETAVYDAQIGHTGAGNVNLALKSGTNSWHGAGSFYNRDDSRSATLYASNVLGTGVTPRDYNRFSATLSGPVFRNRTFFMGSYEKLQDDTIETVTNSVPTERMRRGDFSELLALGVQIFDPTTARLVNGVVTRDPFPGNMIPDDRINPIARNVLNYFPLPNQAGRADLSDNFFAEQPWTYGYNLQLTRIDHEWTSQHRTYGRFIRNFRREERHNFAGNINGVEIARGSTDRFNYNYAVGHTAVLSPSLFFDVRGSWLRFNDDLHPIGQLSPSELGYPAGTLSLLGDYPHIPRFSIESGNPTTAGRLVTLGAQQSGFNTGRAQPFYNMQFTPTLTWTRGNHTWKFGYDWRELRQTELNEGWRGGAYAFDGTYTRASSTAVSQYGQGIAAFMLGIPLNNSFIEIRPEQDYSVISHGVFVHDDWRVGEKLTLNLGVRYDLELGMTEAENRNVRGFDFATPNPIQAQAQAQFAANPPAGVPLSAAQFAVLGGYQFVDDANRRIWDADTNNFQPRFGFTYAVSPLTIVRGGAGLFISPFQINSVPGLGNPVNQQGFARQTPVPVTNDQGLTFQANLTNPVPSGQLLPPNGSSLGLRTNVGASIGSATAAGIIPTDRTNPEYWRFSLGVERQLGSDWLVEVSYLGQKGSHVPIIEQLNFVPQQFRTASAIRDGAAETFLTQAVANPLQGLTPENPGSSGATIARRRLLLQYPHFDNLSIESYRGENTYHALLARLEKRFTGGLMVQTSYTWSRFREQAAPLNPWEDLESRVGLVDRPHRITLASVAELPFGPGHKWGDDWNTVMAAILGGWQFSAKYEWQSGVPLVFNQNTYFDPSCGDPRDLKSQWGKTASGQEYGVDVPIFDTTCFYTLNGQPFRNAAGQVVTFGATEIGLGQSNIRTFPTTLPDVRFQTHHLLDLGLTKNFRFNDRVRVQIRLEALNAENYTLFGIGNLTTTSNLATFGRLSNIDSSTVMKPRDLQLGVRVTF